MHIAILGTRGVPARYGGFETFAEQLGKRLVGAGHKVTVYSRRHFLESKDVTQFQGIEIQYSPTIMHKYLETPIASLTSMVHLLWKSRGEIDLVLLCNCANSPFVWILKIFCIPVIINVDGIERNRSKWNFLGRWWYRLGEICSVAFASHLISDAQVIADYYLQHHKVSSTVIPYGAETVPNLSSDTLNKFSLQPKKYILYVSRLEPENNALGVIQAYVESNVALPLVVVGDAPYASEYKVALRRAANDKVIFTGYQFDNAYHQLRANCYLYIQASEVGGTHPALVEAMAYGNCIIANDVPEHREVLGETGYYYTKNNFHHLAQLLVDLTKMSDKVEHSGKIASERARLCYSWDVVTNSYIKIFEQCVNGNH